MPVFSEKTYQIQLLNEQIEVRLSYGVYEVNNTLAVSLWCHSTETEDYDARCPFDELYGVITVNLPTSPTLPIDEQFIDVNNYPGIGKWLEDNCLASPTGKIEGSGLAQYPAYKFVLP